MKWNDFYMLDIYKELKYDQNEYPLTPLGIVMFLQQKYHIHICIWKVNDEYYTWAGATIDIDDVNVFSEDFNEYKTFDDAVNAAIMECACYASLDYKIEK